jgi:protein-disulfide isomerase
MGSIARAFAVLVPAVLLPLAATAAETRHAVPLGDSPAVGAPGAPVVIVEFIDYQ